MSEEKCQQYNVYDRESKTLNCVPIWLLFVDKDCHHKGEMYFDRSTKSDKPEPGYNAAMHFSFDYMLANLFKKLDAEEFKHIHYLCMKNVENVNSNGKDFNPGCYGFSIDKASEKAKAEWESKRLIRLSKNFIKQPKADSNPYEYLSYLRENMRTSYGALMPMMVVSNYSNKKDEITKKVNSLFENYYNQMENAKNSRNKLSIIVELCEELEIGHFFSDGNQRTIVFVLLNKLLIENGFSPVILEDPSVFDGYHSTDELVEDVLSGMKYYNSQMEKTKELLFDNNNVSFYKEQFGDVFYTTFSNQCKKEIFILNASFILHKANILTKDNWILLLTKLENAKNISDSLSELYTIDPILITKANFNILADHAEYAHFIVEALSKLHRTDPALINDTNRKFLADHAKYAHSIADALSKLYHTDPTLLNDANYQLLVEHAKYARSIADILSKLHQIDPTLLNDSNRELLANHAKDAHFIVGALSKLHLSDPTLVNDANFKLLISSAKHSKKIADTLPKLHKINPTLMSNNINRELLAACAEDAYFIADVLSNLHLVDPMLANDVNFKLLSDNLYHVREIASALSKLHEINPALVNDNNYKLLLNHAKYSYFIINALFTLYRADRTLANDVNYKILIEHAEHARFIDEALSTLYCTDPILVNDINFRLLVNNSRHAKNIGEALSILHGLNPQLVNDANRKLLADHAENAADIVNASLICSASTIKSDAIKMPTNETKNHGSENFISTSKMSTVFFTRILVVKAAEFDKYKNYSNSDDETTFKDMDTVKFF